MAEGIGHWEELLALEDAMVRFRSVDQCFTITSVIKSCSQFRREKPLLETFH